MVRGSAMRLDIGQVIQGKYRIVRFIGDGGMGSVYEARHEYLGTRVALKFLHPELAKRPGLVTRFLREGQVAATIRSLHIVQVLDVDRTESGSAYLVMELLEGESLQQLLDRSARLPIEVALDFTLQILAGLEVAHAAGVVHRDLKPDNVFVVAGHGGPLVKVLDFGIAKLHQAGALTRPGALMGTPEYMAPEQADSADRVDMRADLFAVGAMLYEMLSGQRPMAGADARQIAAAVRERGVVPLDQVAPGLPPGLVTAVHRALAADPAARFSSAAELRMALLPFCGALSPAGRMAATPTPPVVGPGAQIGAGVDAFPPRQVPRTLPPEDGKPDAARTIPDAPPGNVATAAMPAFSPHPTPREATAAMPAFSPPHPTPREATGPMPAFPAPLVHAPPPAMQYVPPPAQPARRPARRRSGLPLGLLAMAAGSLVALGVVAFFALESPPEERLPSLPTPSPATTEVNPVPAEPAPAPTPTILPPEPTAQPTAPKPTATTRPQPAPTTAPTTTTTAPTTVPDAGAAPPDAGTSPKPYPTEIPLPPGLPPGLPTAIPIPEGLPTLPIPIPVFTPQPASSAQAQ